MPTMPDVFCERRGHASAASKVLARSGPDSLELDEEVGLSCAHSARAGTSCPVKAAAQEGTERGRSPCSAPLDLRAPCSVTRKQALLSREQRQSAQGVPRAALHLRKNAPVRLSSSSPSSSTSSAAAASASSFSSKGSHADTAACFASFASRSDLVCVRELPEWYFVYPHVLAFYRPPMPVLKCALSLFQLHNETLNIWSHLLGLFAWLVMFSQAKMDLVARGADDHTIVLTSVAYGMCMMMPLMSSAYHLFKPMSFGTAQFCLRLDMMGILALWFARVLLEGHYVFWCSRESWQYLLVIAVPVFVTLGPLAVMRLERVWPLFPCFFLAHVPLAHLLWRLWLGSMAAGKGAGWLAAALVGLGEVWDQVFGAGLGYRFNTATGFGRSGAPVALSYESGGSDDASSAEFLANLAAPVPDLVLEHARLSLAGTLCAIFGYSFFISQVPERWRPGYFDLVGQSHQIWHVFVWLGPTFILVGFQRLAAFFFWDPMLQRPFPAEHAIWQCGQR